MIFLALKSSFPTCRIGACFISVFRAQQVATHPEFVEAEDIENKNAIKHAWVRQGMASDLGGREGGREGR